MKSLTTRSARHRLSMLCLIVLSCVSSGGCASPRMLYGAPAQGARGFADADKLGASMRGESSQRPILLASTSTDLSQVPIPQRVVIYNAGFRIVVTSVDDAIKSTEQIADEVGGYVQSIKADQIVIRVPVGEYQAVVARVEALGQVVERELEALDVTEEYVDLQARLNNAIKVRSRLEALLEKAETVEAALAVEKELKRVNEEIERLQAKLELIKNRVALSTISVRFERVARRTEMLKGYTRLPFHWLRELDPNRLWLTR